MDDIERNGVLGKEERRISLRSQSSLSGQVFFCICAVSSFALRIVGLTMVTTAVIGELSLVIEDRKISLMDTTLMANKFSKLVHDLTASGAYATLFLILFGSAIIPLFRIFAIVLCFVIPVGERYVRWRTEMISLLDHVGRFILADHFLGGYVCYFFFMQKRILRDEGNAQAIFPHDIELVLGTEVYIAFYSYLSSNILGSLLTHQLLNMNFPSVSLLDNGSNEPKVIFERLSPSRPPGFLFSKAAYFGALILALAGLFDLLILQSHVVTFSLEGIIGLVSNSDPRKFTLWTTCYGYHYGIHEFNQLNDNATYALGVASGIVLIGLPVVLALGALGLGVIPLTKKTQYKILQSCPFWFSWCALDVYFVVTLALYFEMDVLASYLFHDKYPHVCDALEMLFTEPCTQVETQYGRGMFSLALAIVGLLFLRVRLMALARQMNEMETSQVMSPLIV